MAISEERAKRLVFATNELNSIIEHFNNGWEPDFTKDHSKCLICFDFFSKEVSFTTHIFNQPLSYIGFCARDSFNDIKAAMTPELIDALWGKLHDIEDEVEAEPDAKH